MRTNSFSKTFFYLVLLWLCANSVSAQIMQKFGENSSVINDKAVLELESTTKGFLLPRMTIIQRDQIANPPEGLMLWCTDCAAGSGSEVVIWIKNSWKPLFDSQLAESKMLIGNALSKAVPVAISGDLLINSNGVSTIANNAITNAKIYDAAVTDLKIAPGINKSKVGLSNVDNSSDAEKPVSDATKAELNLKLDISAKGALNGVASLVSGKIPSDQIPSISFTSVSVVSSESAMRALNSIVGSVAIRTDLKKNYVLSQPDASILSNWVELLTPAPPVQSVNGKTGNVSFTKTDLILNNVDNTSDLNKPVSTPAKNYIDNQVLSATADATVSATGKIKLAGDLSGTALVPQITVNAITNSKLADYAVTDSKVASGINKSKVGLANVDNISDVNKPLSSAAKNALNLKLDSSKIGQASGAASLDANGKIPSSQIPSISVSAVEVVNSESEMLALIAIIGTTVIRTDTNKNYILSKVDARVLSNWVELLTPTGGIQSINGRTGTVVLTKTDLSLSDVDNTSDANKALSIATSEALDLKEALSNKSLDLNLDPDSDLKYPSVKAVKTYIDGTIGTNVTAETNNRIVADQTLGLNLSAESTRAKAAEAVNSAAAIKLESQVDSVNALEKGRILVGNSNNLAEEVALYGDASLNNTGNLTISTNAINSDKILAGSVSYSKIQNITSNTILGRTTSGSGSVEEIATTGKLQVVLSESPILSGVPEAPTATALTNTNQIATTAFVLANTDGYQSVNASQEIATTSTTEVAVEGMSINPGVGVYSVMFNGQFVSSSAGTTARGIADLSTAYQKLIDATTTNSSHAATFGNGETLSAGVYTIGGAGSIAGTLTLNGTANDIFIFKIHGALATGADTVVKLIGGAQASNVFWVATSAGAMTIAATTKMVGTLFAYNAAASIGSGSILEGRLFSNGGAIAIGPSTITIPTGSSSVNLGELSGYALFTSSGAINNTGTSTITGNIGTNAGAVTGFVSPTVVNGSIFTPEADSGGALTSFSIYQNGVLIPNSTRTKMGDRGDVSLLAIANVLEGQSIDIRWKTSLGKLKLQNRILTLIKVR
ncbi:ice-binding family protein [Flavobacterium sp. LB2P6]|uniref:ice-binding family protein n=1 Tax=Flavobacterium sp. LB2P6 TaxID=3401714 RepID=UPI003AACF956